MEHKARSKQPAEITITYTRSNYSDTDALLAEALKEVFVKIESQYKEEVSANKNTNYA